MKRPHRTTGARRLRLTAALATAGLVVPLGAALTAPGATAAPPSKQTRHHTKPAEPTPAVGRTARDTEKTGPELNGGKAQPLRAGERARASLQAQAEAAATGDAAVGDAKTFLAEDDAEGSIYPKTYTLRGLGDHIEVWVADDRAFPAGDCRNDLGLTEVTDAQVSSFVQQYDDTIYPKESASFSVAPDRDGSDAPLTGALGLPDDYYQVSADQADDVVVLVDNVRDANYYTPTTPDGQTYIAGFFYGLFNDYVNRNVMTIDAYDWLHRTGATPPDDGQDPAYQACSAALNVQPSRALGLPHPYLYEGTFAHEYQHLLESYVDPDESTWVNEGLSDYAQTLTGYVDTSIPANRPDADSHIACFQGYLPASFGGPENSLTLWEDQGGPEVLCDYGAAYSFMTYLADHYGEAFMSALHRQPANGLDGLRVVLKQFGAQRNASQTIQDWAGTMALDRAIDATGTLKGGPKDRFTSEELTGFVNWGSPQAYNGPGAPPNGSDYLRFKDTDRSWLDARDLRNVVFTGARSVPSQPVEWTVDPTPPDSTEAITCGAITPGGGPAALYSGCGEDLDRSIVRPATVPASGGQLTFQTLYDTEEAWDFGFVQVSTDGGSTWTSLPTEDTTSQTDPAAVAGVQANVPGFTGESGGWRTEHADLSAYAGQSILVGFRYITDGAVNEAGFWVRDIDVAGQSLPTSLDGWRTITQVAPIPVAHWEVQLISYGPGGAAVKSLKLDGRFKGRLSGQTLHRALGRDANVVAAIVTLIDPTETVTTEVPYRLSVNGRALPGGGRLG